MAGLDILHPVTMVPMGGANIGSGSGQPIIVNLDYKQDTTPPNPQEKQVWYNTANNKIYTYKNGQWVESDPSVGVWYKFNDKYYLWDGNSLEETDLNIYEKIENKTDNPYETSTIKYPSSYALSEAINNLATLTVFEDNEGTILETHLTLGNSVLVFINGSLLENGADADYTINGSQIIFTIPLQATDKVGVINSNLRAIDLSPYQLKLGASNVITTGEGNIVDSVTAEGGTVTITKNTILDLTPYQQKAQIIEDNRANVADLAIQANKVYKLTNSTITNISFASCEQSELVTKIDFTTGSSNVQFDDGDVINWADGETPHFYVYQHYWIIISNGVGFVKEIY